MNVKNMSVDELEAVLTYLKSKRDEHVVRVRAATALADSKSAFSLWVVHYEVELLRRANRDCVMCSSLLSDKKRPDLL